MKYKYNFDDRNKSNKKKIIFVVVSIVCAIVISSFLFRNNENKIISKVLQIKQRICKQIV